MLGSKKPDEPFAYEIKRCFVEQGGEACEVEAQPM